VNSKPESLLLNITLRGTAAQHTSQTPKILHEELTREVNTSIINFTEMEVTVYTFAPKSTEPILVGWHIRPGVKILPASEQTVINISKDPNHKRPNLPQTPYYIPSVYHTPLKSSSSTAAKNTVT
jgi:hypothetical protein